MKRICKQCGKEFELSQSEINFYKEKNLSIPKRCRECRSANKQKKSIVKEPSRESAENVEIQLRPVTSYRAESAHKRSGLGIGMCILAVAVVLVLYAAGKVIPGWIENTASVDMPVQNQTEADSDRTPSSDRVAESQIESLAESGSGSDSATDIGSGSDTAQDINSGNDAVADSEAQNLPASGQDGGLEDEIAGKEAVNSNNLTFRNAKRLEEHFQKHGIEMGFSSAEEYQAAAAAVVSNTDALHKSEAEDGDDVYYLESTNEFVIVSTDGYIRTYFKPEAGIDYYNRQ